MNKQEIVEQLKQGICKITFEKADGSIRDMFGTLVEEQIEVQSAGKGKDNPDVVVLWDTEKNAWRSFRMDRLISFARIV